MLFRCPSTLTDLTEGSPAICRPYLRTRSYISPHLEPYYQTYAASYVDSARPYLNSFDENVFAPAVGFGRRNYEVYGAPSVEKARTYGQQGWENSVRPKIDQATGTAKTQYDANLGPHVDRVSQVIAPYYDVVQGNVIQTYEAYLLPAYTTSLPYAQQAYDQGHAFTLTTGLPYVRWVWDTVTGVFERKVFPQVRVLYGENVEPQLVRIGERLGRYRDGRKPKAAVDNVGRYAPDSPSILL